MRWFTVWLSTAVGLAIISHLGIGISAARADTVVLASVVLGLVNITVRPIVKLLTLPLNLLSLGLFGWIINALMLWLVSAFVPGFTVRGFIPALWGSILLGLISGVSNWLLRKA